MAEKNIILQEGKYQSFILPFEITQLNAFLSTSLKIKNDGRWTAIKMNKIC